jgi:hypothetical protein
MGLNVAGQDPGNVAIAPLHLDHGRTVNLTIVRIFGREDLALLRDVGKPTNRRNDSRYFTRSPGL